MREVFLISIFLILHLASNSQELKYTPDSISFEHVNDLRVYQRDYYNDSVLKIVSSFNFDKYGNYKIEVNNLWSSVHSGAIGKDNKEEIYHKSIYKYDLLNNPLIKLMYLRRKKSGSFEGTDKKEIYTYNRNGDLTTKLRYYYGTSISYLHDPVALDSIDKGLLTIYDYKLYDKNLGKWFLMRQGEKIRLNHETSRTIRATEFDRIYKTDSIVKIGWELEESIKYYHKNNFLIGSKKTFYSDYNKDTLSEDSVFYFYSGDSLTYYIWFHANEPNELFAVDTVKYSYSKTDNSTTKTGELYGISKEIYDSSENIIEYHKIWCLQGFMDDTTGLCSNFCSKIEYNTSNFITKIACKTDRKLTKVTVFEYAENVFINKKTMQDLFYRYYR